MSVDVAFVDDHDYDGGFVECVDHHDVAPPSYYW